jgi:hypothetical protein
MVGRRSGEEETFIESRRAFGNVRSFGAGCFAPRVCCGRIVSGPQVPPRFELGIEGFPVVGLAGIFQMTLDVEMEAIDVERFDQVLIYSALVGFQGVAGHGVVGDGDNRNPAAHSAKVFGQIPFFQGIRDDVRSDNDDVEFVFFYVFHSVAGVFGAIQFATPFFTHIMHQVFKPFVFANQQ